MNYFYFLITSMKLQFDFLLLFLGKMLDFRFDVFVEISQRPVIIVNNLRSQKHGD